jgi:hypothetical protein
LKSGEQHIGNFIQYNVYIKELMTAVPNFPIDK